MRHARIVIACSLALAVALPCAAQTRPCSKADATAAQKAIERVTSWAQLHKAVKDYSHCDSGSVDDNYTDAMLRLLVDWQNVDALAEAHKDPLFKSFVVKHLKSPLAKEDLESVYSRVKSSCPSGQGALCSDIADVVKPLK